MNFLQEAQNALQYGKNDESVGYAQAAALISIAESLAALAAAVTASQPQSQPRGKRSLDDLEPGERVSLRDLDLSGLRR
jgi:hypothetical protein